ncbi:hypothetical protein EV360DRAFT_89878 [Lentinula raphanica]|nr:hypothetical protein EV360DRAFT_89878 [Lentinula raphanica]
MAEALNYWSFKGGAPMSIPLRPAEPNESLMGLWVNGMPESLVAWFIKARIPVFVCHEIKGLPNSPVSDKYSIWVKGGLNSCELEDTEVIRRWTNLYKEAKGSEGEVWDGGYNREIGPFDKMDRWRSSSRASKSNFPGEDWGTIMGVPVEVVKDKWFPPHPQCSSLDPTYESYIVPPPVQASNDLDNDGERCFKYTDKEEVYSSYDYSYVERTGRRYIHSDSQLYISPYIVHPIEVFGLPGPRLKFYDDFQCQAQINSPFWVYKKEYPIASNVGKTRDKYDVQSEHQLPHSSPAHKPQMPESRADGIPSLTSTASEGMVREERKPPEILSVGRVGATNTPKSNLVDSLIPGEFLVSTWNVTPFVRIDGIRHVEVAEFREWLLSNAPTLKVSVIARTKERKYVDRKIVRVNRTLYIKFWNRQHASSFWHAFQGKEVLGKNMKIDGQKMEEFKGLRKKDIIDYWGIELAGKLNPLANRIKDSLLDRITDSPLTSTSKGSLFYRLSDPPHIAKRPFVRNSSDKLETRNVGNEGDGPGRIMTKTRRRGVAWQKVQERFGDMV